MKDNKIFSGVLWLLVMLLVMVSLEHIQAQEATGLQQFTAGGHVLGFHPECVYVVGSDHMLKVMFADAHSITPIADQPQSGDNQVQPLGKITYPHLWDSISLTYQQVAGGVAKSSYLLEAGAEVGQIRLRYNVPMQVNSEGRLIFDFETGEVTESAPIAWQEIDGQRASVSVSYCQLAEMEVGFTLGTYDPAYPLVIDPTWQWHTFMGSYDIDYGYSIAVDDSGNVYVAGQSYATWGAPINPYAGSHDAFVAKLSSSGMRQWHTFMGSGGDDEGRGIAVDSSGNVYVAGYSYATWGAPIHPHAGSYDAFVAKFSSSGMRQWHTFMGSGGDDEGWGIAADGSGNVYVAGQSYATWGTPVNPYAGSYDAFVAKFNNNGIRQWHTFMGSGANDGGRGVAVDGSGKVYVAGYSNATWGTPVYPYAGSYDAFAATLSPNDVQVPTVELVFPKEYKLYQNHTNPFNPTTAIKFSNAKTEFVTLKIFNILGEVVATLVSEELSAGSHKYQWDASNLASGVYLYMLQAGEKIEMRKMVLMK